MASSRLHQFGTSCALGITAAALLASPALAQEASAYEDAAIDWRQAEGSTITVGGLQHPWMDAIEPLIPQFEDLTGIEVEVDRQSESEYVAAMPVRLSSGATDPDVYMIWALGQAISAGWLMPLDEAMANEAVWDADWYNAEDLFPSARSFQVWSDGVAYAVPITAEAQTMFYNSEMLEQAGLEVPQTMDGLKAAAAAMKSDDVSGIAMRSKATGDAAPWTAAGFIFSNGGAIVTPEGTSGLASPETVEAVATYAELLRESGPLGVGNYHWMESLNDFMQGATAISGDSSNFATDIENPEKSLLAGKTTYGALPSFGEKPAKPNMWHWMVGVNANTDAPDAATLFLLWATSQPTAIQAAAAGLATPRASAWESDAFRERFGAQAAEAALANLSAADGDLFKATWFHPRSAEILDAVAIAVNQAVTGAQSAEEALAEADAKVTAILAESEPAQ